MRQGIMSQLQIHKRIDEFFKAGIGSADFEVVKELIVNEDAKKYFFLKANEEWLQWIFENGFFEELKNPSKDTRIVYRLPELEYLTRMVEKKPQLVADVINTTPISKETLNPEVINRFLWIIGLLPSEQIKFLIPKILREDWIRLLSIFNRSGYEFQDMVEKIKDAKEFKILNTLAEIILTPRDKEDIQAREKLSISDNAFYLHDVTETGIFDAILLPENTEKENSLGLLLKILGNIVRLGKKREGDVFIETEPFYLLDVDIFNLELNTDKRNHSNDDIQNLVATAAALIKELFFSANENEKEARRLYETYIKPLPDSRTLYRLKLFAITRCASLFKWEIKDAFFRVFEVGERYFEIDGGVEYHTALREAFGTALAYNDLGAFIKLFYQR